jgi:hypothetical protein
MSGKVSVVIPAYNAAPFLEEALDSVLAQGDTVAEVIVCNDRSQDGTGEIARSYAGRGVVHVLNERNLGPAGNFNACLDRATAEFVCLFHADDVMQPGNMERKVAVLARHPGCGLAHSNARIVDSAGLGISLAHPETDTESIQPGLEAFRDWWDGRHSVVAPSVVMRRSVVEKVGRFETGITHTQDLNFWLRMAAAADVAYLAEPLILYRQHPGQDSKRYAPSRLIQEDFLARVWALARAGATVPGAAALREQAGRTYAIRALNTAEQRMNDGDVAEVRALLALVRRIGWRWTLSRDYLRLQLKSLRTPAAAGPRPRHP